MDHSCANGDHGGVAVKQGDAGGRENIDPTAEQDGKRSGQTKGAENTAAAAPRSSNTAFLTEAGCLSLSPWGTSPKARKKSSQAA